MSGSGTGDARQGRSNTKSNKQVSNQALIDDIVKSTPTTATPKPPFRQPKLLSTMERRTENGMINSAPNPVFRRTEENDPMPSLADAVDALNEQRDEEEDMQPPKRQKTATRDAASLMSKAATTAAPKRVVKIPEAPGQAEKCDKMLWERKVKGDGWMEIAEEWEKLTETNIATEEEDVDPDAVKKRREKRRRLIERLAVRFDKLKQSYAASGTMELPDSFYKANPADKKYKIISDRKKQDVHLIDVMEETKAQMDDEVWKTFCRNYKAKVGEEISEAEARARYEALINGVAKLKPTAAEEKDMLEIKKEKRRDPVTIKDEE